MEADADADIIAAIATPPGQGGIGVIRLSGKNLAGLAQVILGKLPRPRHAQLCDFQDTEHHIIDQGIALYFPAPHSYTGEDVLELQGHGGTAILNLLLEQCLKAGARMAQPGEFTLRAYLNNKIDLIQAEGVADIIAASTTEAVRCAIQSLRGNFSQRIDEMVNALITLRMLIEATLDFPEEEIDSIQIMQIKNDLQALQQRFEDIFAAARQGHILQEGIKIVLVGSPNVGKSSLLNQLAEEDAAIVTDIPGTTRDTIQRNRTINAIPLHIIDTAGLRDTSDLVEQKGIERTLAAIDNADVVIHLIDFSSTQHQDPLNKSGTLGIPADKPIIMVFNKIDLLGQDPRIEQTDTTHTVYISAKTGAGIELLRDTILNAIGWKSQPSPEGIYMARQRHLEALTQARSHLQAASGFIDHQYQLELLAEELRLTQTALTSITGRFTPDDLLGEIFSHFCIGK